jgi:hypothetical protein
MNKETQQQLREYRQFLLRIQTYCENDEQRKSFDQALVMNTRCIIWLKEQDTNKALIQWSKGEAQATKNYHPPAWSPKQVGKGQNND